MFDTSILGAALLPDKYPLIDLDTGEPVEDAPERFAHLIRMLEESREKIIMPTPVLSEILTCSGSSFQFLRGCFTKKAVFKIAPFGEKAAIEVALAIQDARQLGGSQGSSAAPQATKAKTKFDRQIVAIAKVESASKLYTNDKRMRNHVKRVGLDVGGIGDIDLPPQQHLPL